MTRTIVHLVLAALLLTGASQLHAQNLVTNGGFESGFPGWTNATSGGASASFSLETAQPYAGAKALKAVINTLGSEDWSVQTLGPTFTNLGSGRSVSVTFRARAATAGTRVRFVMQSNVYKKQDFTLSTAWERFTWNHTTAETSPRLRIQYLDKGTVWLDEISVVANPEPGENIRISLAPSIRHQTMEGIGGALTWYASRMLTSPEWRWL